jgi:hypothetical protein
MHARLQEFSSILAKNPGIMPLQAWNLFCKDYQPIPVTSLFAKTVSYAALARSLSANTVLQP